MKVAILAGGVGSRLSEETETKPKPMVEVGGQPILWHLMKYYSHFGYDDFVVALGFKGEYIKRWFADAASLANDLTINFRDGSIDRHGEYDADWRVSLIDTGQPTATGGRIKRLQEYVGDETFMLTWGDGLSTVNLDALLEFHRSHGRLATLTAVRPPARFGHLSLNGERVNEFSEKPQTAEGWINGAFFVLEPGIFDYIEGDDTQFEHEPLSGLARDGELMAYQHEGFWQCMDTLRDKKLLDAMCETWAPWMVWSRPE